MFSSYVLFVFNVKDGGFKGIVDKFDRLLCLVMVGEFFLIRIIRIYLFIM